MSFKNFIDTQCLFGETFKAIKMNGPNKIKAMISIEKLKERSAYIKKLLKDTV